MAHPMFRDWNNITRKEVHENFTIIVKSYNENLVKGISTLREQNKADANMLKVAKEKRKVMIDYLMALKKHTNKTTNNFRKKKFNNSNINSWISRAELNLAGEENLFKGPPSWQMECEDDVKIIKLLPHHSIIKEEGMEDEENGSKLEKKVENGDAKKIDFYDVTEEENQEGNYQEEVHSAPVTKAKKRVRKPKTNFMCMYCNKYLFGVKKGEFIYHIKTHHPKEHEYYDAERKMINKKNKTKPPSDDLYSKL